LHSCPFAKSKKTKTQLFLDKGNAFRFSIRGNGRKRFQASPHAQEIYRNEMKGMLFWGEPSGGTEIIEISENGLVFSGVDRI